MAITTTFYKNGSIIIAAHKDEKDGLLYNVAELAKKAFEQSNNSDGSGIICLDPFGRIGYCVVFEPLKPEEH